MEKGILYFSAPWCGPCKMMSPTMDELQKQGMNIKKINIDYDVTFTQKYNVKSVPTCILTDLDGNEVKRKVGRMDVNQIKEFYNG
tara:strand:+ start:347 stop:601 length:255 start_codon:yes stop_codon:yes gene_type:complete